MAQQTLDWKEDEKLVGYVVNRIAGRLPAHIDLEDLKSVGVIGLIDAANKFDPAKDCSFKTYAEIRIKGAIIDQLRAMDWVPRSVRAKGRKLERAVAKVEQTLGRSASDEEVADFLDIATAEFHELRDRARGYSTVSLDASNVDEGGTLGEVVEDIKSENPFAALNQAEGRAAVAAAIATLPEKEQLLISFYYFEDLSLKEVGALLGVSESRACQIHTKATASLRAKLAN